MYWRTLSDGAELWPRGIKSLKWVFLERRRRYCKYEAGMTSEEESNGDRKGTCNSRIDIAKEQISEIKDLGMNFLEGAIKAWKDGQFRRTKLYRKDRRRKVNFVLLDKAKGNRICGCCC